MPVTMTHKHMLDLTLFYTGWTRAQILLILVGEREAVKYAIETTRTGSRNTRLREFTERFANDLGLKGTPFENSVAAPIMTAESVIKPAPRRFLGPKASQMPSQRPRAARQIGRAHV